MTANAPMLRTEALSKSFGQRLILNKLELSLASGIYALQGPNGSGKSTLLNVLSGAIPADSGEVWINQFSLNDEAREARRHMAYAPDECPLYPFLTGRQFLLFVSRVRQVPLSENMQSLLLGFSLEQHLDARFDAMSLGTQKKFLLLAAFLGKPAVYLADEPSNGLDKQTRSLLVTRFREMRKSHVILFTSHDAQFVDSTEAEILHINDIVSSVKV